MIKLNFLYYLFGLFCCVWSSTLIAQTTIRGNIVTADNQGLSGASIIIDAIDLGVLSEEDGSFQLSIPQQGIYTLTISYLGKRTVEKILEIGSTPLSIDVLLLPDPLELSEVIVTGTFQATSKFASSIASSTLSQKQIQQQSARGTADLLNAVPGIFVDASAGEIFTKAYSRGIAASAEDDIGWYYLSLQEEGLPITNYQTTYYGPDLFHRTDLTTKRMEAIRGGNAVVTSTNAPGGIINFISKTGGQELQGELLATTGLQGDNNGLFRYDMNIGGSLASSKWQYNIGGFYRYDQGPRNTDITWGNGGQLKGNIFKQLEQGTIKFYAKYLNDQVNRYSGLPATNWESPQAAFGQNFTNSALLLPKVRTSITDGRFAGNDANASYVYDSDKGVATKDVALGMDVSKGLRAWMLRSNLKISSKSADWQSTIANQPLGLEGFFPYLLSGIDPTFQNIPLGQIVFRDAQQGNVVARVNNFGILGPFQGEPASFEYLEGILPNDAVMGIAPWKKLDEATEIMEQLTLSRTFDQHHLTLGGFFAYSDIESFTSASYAYATYESSPRMLAVTVENPGDPIIELSDVNGISNYGGLLYNRGDASIRQLAFFINDHFQVTDGLAIDGGLRYENIGHKGAKDRSSPSFTPGGIDGDETTAYNNSVLLATEEDPFDFNYDYLSWSLGFNYQLDRDVAFFARFSNGHKAPEMNYYFNNFNGIPINERGTVQDILQGELGYKLVKPSFSLMATGFWSQLNNIPFSEFVFDQSNGGIFFPPIQFNKTTTIGLELEGVLAFSANFDVNFTATYQNSAATDFTIYNANGTIEETDDTIIDYSGNELPHNPDVMFSVSPTYTWQQFAVFATWRYMGVRQANLSNGFKLPAFSTVNLGIDYAVTNRVNLSVIANNLFNSTGLMNFYGPNEFGSNSNVVTPMYVEQNPDASFVVFPINPRSIYLKMGYQF